MKPKLIFIFLIFNFAFLIEVTATVRYVSKTGSSTPPYTTWATASDSIQKCINICQNGDTVYVANGVYKEKIVMIPGLALIGSGMDSCIIDSQEIIEPTAFSNLVFADSCKLIGFQILFPNLDYTLGIKCRDILNESSLIANNKISNGYRGIDVLNSNLTIAGNIISNVDRGININGFTFEYFPIIENNIILYPSSMGIFDFSGCQPTITNNVIYLNYEYSRGLDFIAKTPLTANNIVIAESDIAGGGYSFIFDGNIQNNFLIGHTINDVYAVFHFRYGSYVVKKNLVMNTSKGASVYQINTFDFKYNNLWNISNPYSGFTPDSTNLSVDPMIISEDSGDVHLQMYSPMIDAGDPNILDRDGSRSDIGPYGGPLGEKYTYRDLAPKPPKNVTAVYVNKVVKLKWNRNTEADFSYYRIYRDTVPHFIYDTTKIVGVTSDTTFSDNLPISTTAKNYYYMLTGLDSTNHQSAPSEEVMVLVTGMNEVPPRVVEEYKLLNNYPNPFNSSTIIPYRLKEGGYVKLIIYNVMGEVVGVLVNEYQPKGYYEAEFSPSAGERQMGEIGVEYPTGYNDDIASGLYIYSLKVRGDGDIPVFTSIGKMILLK